MNTVFLLMAEFNTQADIPLDQVADKYLGIAADKAKKQAAMQRLPFPVFRAGTQKSPWLVRVTDLAHYLDQQRAQATKEWQAQKEASQ